MASTTLVERMMLPIATQSRPTLPFLVERILAPWKKAARLSAAITAS